MSDKAIEAALLPCPFCGSDNFVVRADLQRDGVPVFSIHCGDCRSSSGLWFTRDDAATAWNRVWYKWGGERGPTPKEPS